MSFDEPIELLSKEEIAAMEKEIAELPKKTPSRKTRKDANAFFREDLGIDKAHHPEVDNGWERFRTRMYLKYPQYPWLSRLYQSRKRRGRV